jgi:hypothetical protein
MVVSAANDVGQRDDQLRSLFRQIFQREPTPLERDAAVRLLENKSLKNEEAWRLIAHGLLASNEFLYID